MGGKGWEGWVRGFDLGETWCAKGEEQKRGKGEAEECGGVAAHGVYLCGTGRTMVGQSVVRLLRVDD